jgi:DNA-binding NarL/FixJ family response regulator
MDQTTEATSVRIVIVDDHPAVIRGLCGFFESELGFRVVGVATDQDEFLQLLAAEQADIALVDLVLGDAELDVRPSGIELIERAQKLAPQLRCIAYSAYEKYGREAIDAGAWAYILKNTPMDRLAEVIRDVRHDKYVYPHEVMSHLHHRVPDPDPCEKPLTKREKEILGAWVRHPEDTRAAVAIKLGITEGAVRTHLRNIYQKLQVHSRAEAIFKAQELGLC